MSADQEAQTDELLALESIYDGEEFHRTESRQSGKINLCLELPPNFRLLVKGEACVECGISFLPPLVLSFELPTDYPSSLAPVFTLSSKWLSRVQITTLCKRLDELWEENRGTVVLFTWIQFLKEETLEFLNLQSPLEIQTIGGQPHYESGQTQSDSKVQELDQRAVQEVDPHTDILTQLLDFNEAQKQKVFDSKVFRCGICFSENLGSNSLLFKECQHVYCKTCLKEYFQIQIRDGKVQSLTCPEPECMSLASPAQVKLLVGEEEFTRYDRLLLQSSLHLMADVVYCPRMSCCMAVMIEPDANMGICPSCRFVFCTLCKRVYHGLSLCKEVELRRLRDEYLAASEKEKERLGKEMEQLLIQRAEDEALSEDWVMDNTKLCPSCHVNIQKTMGCNKMTCFSCQKYFCWICLAVLDRRDPYSHFRDPNSPCLVDHDT
ncbi:E3 ubiquitin-protein ligase RNF14-like [Pimephales promelas]|uniref:E3 ubiquitin-protein ligase RNF14-like n=1 Tax=Pimephales promelas TaxID=90988 RepID=UPI00195566A4|nr:E3 ubiquitin-protein ligase RNF14-like [Pimephales promelas]XP_039515995.1 E3 ubiquitin-protein ligase RNF14-like [Pimephales promelas]XP_039515997.1 E3 ubiquitin-protein ligase RNF14-like [Pimephales promelas]KAG1932857.1 E3 ubiquitin-protein ligase RNF14 [Pimephales promelas]